MISGAAFWDYPKRYYIQTNNSVERMLSRYDARASLVTCGPSATINCLSAMGYSVDVVTRGGWRAQPEDVLALWFHDPRNWPALRKVRSATDPEKSVHSPHEVPQYYPIAAKSVFGVTGVFKWGADFDAIIDDITTGHTVMINLREGATGHFVAVIAYDEDKDELIYHDSYPAGIPGHNGFAVRVSRDDFDHTDPYRIIYGSEE